MDKRNFIFLTFLLLSISVLAQVNNSVLSNGKWARFYVDTAGVFKINKALLQEIGISTTNLDPRTLKIYGNNGGMLPEKNSDFRYNDIPENSIYIKGESDGIFNDEDFILFSTVS